MSKWIELNKDTCIILDKIVGFEKHEYFTRDNFDDNKYAIHFQILDRSELKVQFSSKKERDVKFKQIQKLLGITDDQ